MTEAPLSQWFRHGSFDTAKECYQTRQTWALSILKQIADFTKTRRMSTGLNRWASVPAPSTCLADMARFTRVSVSPATIRVSRSTNVGIFDDIVCDVLAKETTVGVDFPDPRCHATIILEHVVTYWSQLTAVANLRLLRLRNQNENFASLASPTSCSDRAEVLVVNRPFRKLSELLTN
jgi:hypothetical protein